MVNKISSKNLIRYSILIIFVLWLKWELIQTLQAKDTKKIWWTQINKEWEDTQSYFDVSYDYSYNDMWSLNTTWWPWDRLNKMLSYANETQKKEISKLIKENIQENLDTYRRIKITLDELYSDNALSEECKFAIWVWLLWRWSMRETVKAIIKNKCLDKYNYYRKRPGEIELVELDEISNQQDNTIRQQRYERQLLNAMFDSFGLDSNWVKKINLDSNWVKKK